MTALSPYQVATIRILSAGLLLLPFCVSAIKKIPGKKLPAVFLSGFIGSFIPAYLFCIAETEINSSLAGILNATTPFFTIIIGSLFFQLSTPKQKFLGVLIGFAGMVALPFAGGKDVSFSHVYHISLVVFATLLYGLNVNVVARYLHHIESIHIASFAFVSLIPICIIILYKTGYFNPVLFSKPFYLSTLAAFTLGAGGTAIATVLFYKMLKSAGAVMASMVTYGIPFFSVMWGLIGGEQINLLEILCLLVILSGVFLVNRRPKGLGGAVKP